MKLVAAIFFTLAGTAVQMSAAADEFDRSLLRGKWVELFGSDKPSCLDALLFEHELSADGKFLTTRFIRNWLFAEAYGSPRVSERREQVVRTTRNTLVVRGEGEAEPGVPVEWEMIFLSPGLYKLRADGWETDEGDFVRRARCR